MNSQSILEILGERHLAIETQQLASPYPHIGLYLLDLTNFFPFPTLRHLLLITLDNSIVLDTDSFYIVEELVNSMSLRDDLKLLEFSRAQPEGINLCRQLNYAVLIDRSNLDQHKSLIQQLEERIVNALPLVSLNPYVFSGPVTDKQFFGRDNELSTVMNQRHRSFVISGSRKSGKTSLMLELIRRIRQLGHEGEVCIYIDFETCTTPSDVPYTILTALSQALRIRSSELVSEADNYKRLAASTQWDDSPKLSRLVNSLWTFVTRSSKAHTVRFLCDEFDRVVTLEKKLGNSVFLSIFRDILARSQSFNAQISPKDRPLTVQFVMAGSKNLYEELLSQNSPLHNLAAKLTLGNFDFDTLMKVISNPLTKLRVNIVNPPAVTQALLEITGGHPSTTQNLCSVLVCHPETQRTRLVTEDLVRRVGLEPEFLGAFADTIDKNVSPLGRFILLQAVVKNKSSGINVDFVRGVASSQKVRIEDSVIGVNLQDLADSGFLKLVGFVRGHKSYELSTPTLKHVLQNADVREVVSDLLADGVALRVPG